MRHVNWMTLRFNNIEYTLTDQAYDWIRRFHTDPKTGEVVWEKMIEYFETAMHGKEIKEEDGFQ